MSNTPWHTTNVLSPATVRTLIEEQFPELCPITDVTYLDQGFDNTVYVINNHIIFRFPRKTDTVTLLLREHNILLHLQGRFQLQIPNPLYMGTPSALFPHPFHGYHMLTGTSGCYITLSPAQRAVSIIPLAQFLHTLHNIPKNTLQSWNVAAPVYDRTNWTLAAPKLRKRISHIQQSNTLIIDSVAIEHEITCAESLKLSNKQVLVHNDLYAKHLLFKNGALHGIIDWGDSCVSHPTVDLAIIQGFYPSSCHQNFFQVYGSVDQDTWEYARFLAVYYACTLAWYALEQEDSALLHDSVASLQRLDIAATLN